MLFTGSFIHPTCGIPVGVFSASTVFVGRSRSTGFGLPVIADFFMSVFQSIIGGAMSTFFVVVLIHGGVIRFGEGSLCFLVGLLESVRQFRFLGIARL